MSMNRRNLLAAAVLGATGLSGLAPAQAAESVMIGVSLASDLNPFYIAMKRGIELRAEALGVKVAFVTANEVVANQVNGIQDLVARGVDGILASPIDSVAVGTAYRAAAQAGIPVISVARHAKSSDQTAFISMDEPGLGVDIGNWIAKKIDGQGEVAMIMGPAGAATFRALAQGVDESFAAFPDIKVVYRKDAPLLREAGLQLAEDALIAHPKLVAIYTANDELALGAAQAVAAAGRAGDVVVTGMNGIPPALKAVKAGRLGLTVDLKPVDWGELAVDTMVDYLNGKEPSSTIAARYELVDQDNVEQVLASAAQ